MADSLNSIVSRYKQTQKGREVIAIYNGGDNYLLSTAPIGLKSNDINTDPYYVCDKSGNRFAPFDPIRNAKWYKQAMKNQVWHK